MSPFPRNPYPIDPRAAIVSFYIKINYYSIEEAAENGDEVAVELLADSLRTIELELLAQAEVERRLRKAGFRSASVTNYGHTQHGELSCHVGVSSWIDVRKLWDWISYRDIIYLETPFAEACEFVLFPNGYNGKRFGPSERGGSIEDWLDANRPRGWMDDARPLDDRPVLLADWEDGWKLFRRVIPLRAGDQNDQILLELLDPRNELVVRATLSEFGSDYEHFPDTCSFETTLSPRHSRDEEAREKLRATFVPRLLWFLDAATPTDRFRGQMNELVVEDLGLPRWLRSETRPLFDDPGIEEQALATHLRVSTMSVDTNGSIAGLDDGEKAIFVRTVRALGGEHVRSHEDGSFSQEGQMVVFSSQEGNEYSLFFGPLRQTGAHERYEPGWSVHTRWVAENGPASWYVVNVLDAVIGAGRTPAEALRDVPNFVIPDEEVAWRERRIRPGRFVYEPELYLLLGDWPPFFWRDEAFVEWSRSAEPG